LHAGAIFPRLCEIRTAGCIEKFRKSRLAFELCRSGVDLARRKGFRRLYAHSREGLEGFYARFGATPMGSDRKLSFSGFNYTEMLLELEPSQDAITLDSGGYVILRPEGDWDQPGILEISATRPVRDPRENAVQFTHVVT
jgi:hypothetical protein